MTILLEILPYVFFYLFMMFFVLFFMFGLIMIPNLLQIKVVKPEEAREYTGNAREYVGTGRVLD